MSVCGCVCIVLSDATAITFANASFWFLYAKRVRVTFGRSKKSFCDGSNVVNKWRSAYSSVRNSADKCNGSRIRNLRGSGHTKRLCAGLKIVNETWHFNEPCDKLTCFVCILRTGFVFFLGQTQSSEEKNETQLIEFFLNSHLCLLTVSTEQ